MRHLLALALVAAGCQGSPVATPEPPRDPCHDGSVLCIAPASLKNKVDLLFVLDDAPSMAVKLDAFRAALPGLVSALGDNAQNGSPVSYHLGVVTADLGAGPETLPQFGCQPGGDGGRLRDAGGGGGVRFIDYNQLNGTSNVGDVTAALSAIADVGSAGCAFRHPLEAAYSALHDPISENIGFLRSDAVLVVVFVSDADDCSAPPATDLFDGSAAGVASYGALDPFRCTQFGIACNGMPVPPMSIAGLTGCESQTMADGGKLLDVQRYIDFFSKPAAQGGVKLDPDDVILAAVTGPSDPVGVTVSAMQPVLNHSCIAAADVRFFGDPAVRLNSVVRSVRNSYLTSVCDPDDATAIKAVDTLLMSRTSGGCLNTAVAARADGTPDCVVEDVTAYPDGSVSRREIPSCAENGNVTPCWALVDRLAQYDAQGCQPLPPSPSTCKLPPTCQPIIDPVDGRRELYTVTVERGANAAPPPGTTTNISCATIPPSP